MPDLAKFNIDLTLTDTTADDGVRLVRATAIVRGPGFGRDGCTYGHEEPFEDAAQADYPNAESYAVVLARRSLMILGQVLNEKIPHAMFVEGMKSARPGILHPIEMFMKPEGRGA